MRDRIVVPVLPVMMLASTLLGQTYQEVSSLANLSGPPSSGLATNTAWVKVGKPLRLSTDPEPLLLLEDGPAADAPTAGWADNRRCQVCHLNFMTEQLTVSHARTNIGCATCHGPSDAHIADESWASGGKGTPPDKLFTRYQIFRACSACHTGEQVFNQVEKHQPFWWSIASQEKVCTDCHGRHRIPTKRRCTWK